MPSRLFVRVKMDPLFLAAVQLRQELLKFLIESLVRWDEYFKVLQVTKVKDIQKNWPKIRDT